MKYLFWFSLPIKLYPFAEDFLTEIDKASIGKIVIESKSLLSTWLYLKDESEPKTVNEIRSKILFLQQKQDQLFKNAIKIIIRLISSIIMNKIETNNECSGSNLRFTIKFMFQITRMILNHCNSELKEMKRSTQLNRNKQKLFITY